MSLFAKKIMGGLMPSVLLVAFGVLVSGDLARACEGTLCDLMGANDPKPTGSTQPAAPTPLTVPSTGGILGFFASKPTAAGQTASTQSGGNSLVNVQGGGLATAFTSPSNQRCTGTICDFFYRGAPPEPAAQPAAQQAAATQQSAAAPAPLPSTARYKTVVEAVEPREKPLCHSATDPWHCFR